MVATNGKPETNGKVSMDRIGQTLTAEPLTTGYQPTFPIDTLWGMDGAPWLWFRRDIELMLTHPIVRNAMDNFRAGIAGAEFDCKSENVLVQKFILNQCQRYWDIGVPQLQGGYEYGWIGGENLYEEVDGMMEWNGLNHFSPADTFLLTQGSVPVGVRVKSIKDKPPVDLWMASSQVPAKGMWYVHNPRYNLFYGQSQLFGAWRPWRRLAWKDGAETVIDTGVYRFAFCGPVIGFPDEDLQSQSPGPPNTTLDSNGNPRRYARDIARQAAEQMKAGAGYGFPTGNYPQEMGGGPKWTFEWPDHSMDVEPLIGYARYLHDQIYNGIGVPAEMIQAAETGSGYSGRRIPLEAFLDRQQCIGDAFLRLFVEQVLKPLVLWNFGPVRFDVKLKRLLETKNKASAGQPGQTGQQQPGQNPGQQNPPSPAQQAPQGEPPQTAKFSANPLITDRIRVIARKALQKVA